MSVDRDRSGPSWVEAGALLGGCLGLGDGLRSVAYAEATPGEGSVALLVATLLPIWGIGVGLPLFVALFTPRAGRGAHLGPGAWRRGLRAVGWVSTAAVPASLVGLLVLYLVMALRPAASHNLQGLVALAVVVVLAGAVRRSPRAASGLLRPVVIVPAALVLLLAFLGLAPRGRLEAPRYLDSGNAQPAAAASWPERPPNILLVMLDTTRADRLSVYGYGEPTTPFLEKLAREATLYERAIAPAPWTLPSAASLFTGQLPYTHQAHEEHRLLRDEFVTLAELLAAHGYRTAGFSSNIVVGETYNLHQGFQQFYEVSRKSARKPPPSALQRLLVMRAARRWRRAPAASGRDKGAAECNALVGRWLDSWERSADRAPFFVFVNYLEAHLPYVPPQPHRANFFWGRVREQIRPLVSDGFTNGAVYRLIGYRDLMEPEDYRQLSDLYDAALAYQDAQLRRLVGELAQRGILDDTVVVVVGDHGENLGEHGGLLGHALSVHQTLLHVPLLVRYPAAFKAGLRHPGLVAATGLFPTLLELAGASPDAAWPPAVAPLPRRAAAEHEVVVSEYAVPVFELYELANEARGVDVGPWLVRKKAIQSRDWKLVRPSAGEAALFHLAEDPGETTRLDPLAHPAGEALGRRLDEILAALPRPTLGPFDAREALEEETREALRALGYLQ